MVAAGWETGQIIAIYLGRQGTLHSSQRDKYFQPSGDDAVQAARLAAKNAKKINRRLIAHCGGAFVLEHFASGVV